VPRLAVARGWKTARHNCRSETDSSGVGTRAEGRCTRQSERVPLDDHELRDLVERRLCEAADHLDILAGVPDDELSGAYEEAWRHLWGSVEGAMWRLAEHQNPGRWSPLTPDGLWPAIARRGVREVEGWGMAWFLDDDLSSTLTPFRAHVLADATSVSLDADFGERGTDGTLVLYNRSEGMSRHASLAVEADDVRWATSVSAMVPRSRRS
jgi:hypothetical protein